MFGSWTAIGVGSVLAAVSCGGAVERSGPDLDPSGNGGTDARAGSGGRGQVTAGSPGVSGAAAGVGGTRLMDAGIDDDAAPVNSGCTVDQLPPPTHECDAFSNLGECGPGMGCYPFVQHPGGDGCDAQVYGTVCMPAGVGSQGALCGDDTGDWCGPGHVCVIGQRPGKRCAALCRLGVPNQCADGLLCSDLDVAGFGVCG